MLNEPSGLLEPVHRVGDVIERVFDPSIPERLVLAEELRRVSWARDGVRIEQLLREVPLSNVRAPIVAALLTHLGVEALAPLLGALMTTEAVAPLTRGVAAYLLARERVNPHVSAELLPVAAESLLLGSSLLGQVSEVGPVLAHWFTRRGADVSEIVRRVDGWRPAAIAPDAAIFGPALASRACARHHARLLASCTPDPATDRAVQQAVLGKALDPLLAGAFLARPRVPGSLTGRLWIGPPADRFAWTGWALVDAHDEYRVAIHARLAVDGEAEVSLSPLLARSGAEEFARRLDANDAARPAPLATLTAALRRVRAEDPDVQRAAWLLGRCVAAG